MRGRIETRRGEVRGKRDMSVMGASSSSLPADASIASVSLIGIQPVLSDPLVRRGPEA